MIPAVRLLLHGYLNPWLSQMMQCCAAIYQGSRFVTRLRSWIDPCMERTAAVAFIVHRPNIRNQGSLFLRWEHALPAGAPMHVFIGFIAILTVL